MARERPRRVHRATGGSRLPAFAAGVALMAVAPRAGAHGSRVVPLEDQPIEEVPKPPLPPAPLSVTPAPASWTGLRLGAQVGYGFAQASSTLLAPSPTKVTDSLGTLLGGVHAGYDRQLGAHALLGAEADVAFPYFADDGVVLSRPATAGGVTQKLDFVSSLRARVGGVQGPWLFYGTAGLAWAQARFTETATASGATTTQLRQSLGWTGGGGVELALGPRWSVQAEYRFDRLGAASGVGPSGTGAELASTTLHHADLGLTWRFDGVPRGDAADDAGPWLVRPERWTVHGQATFIEQGYLAFRSPYQGANSLTGAAQFANTVSATAFVGARLWPGAGLYVNPEIDQGFGLSQTLGIAGFPNGEAQKASYPDPRLNIDRVMIRQTFGLGGELAKVEDGPNQLPETRDVSRLTVTAGRFSVGDLFGLNSYAADPRTQFFNWNIYGSGSYDWTMDRPGFTWGAAVELNEARWALRAGYFLEPTEANGNTYDTNVGARGQYLLEPEVRYRVGSQPGVFRLLLWATRANMGSYAEAVAERATTPGYPDITATRQLRVTYGFVANVEQAITRDLGVFSRASWTPGLVEVMGWTDCDESLSVGGQLFGRAWRRPDDRIGLGGVVEGLSPEARAYFEAGGMGIVIGDGRMNYRPEAILEAYYALSLAPWAALTFDYQLVGNPAYNADRGPVPVYALRLHAEL